MPERIRRWLNARGITDAVIAEYQLGWNGTHIVIPVHDADGKVLFNKYRRDPDQSTVTPLPKYTYDKGATSQLYGLKTLADAPRVHVVEGEMDALCLISKGITAVSSTGGAGTWRESWGAVPDGPLAGRDCVVCYDFDDAGVKGAFAVSALLPQSVVARLPKEVGEHGDVTDFFTKLGRSVDDFLALPSFGYIFPPDLKADLVNLKERERMTKVEVERMMEEARRERAAYRSDRWHRHVIETLVRHLDDIKKARTRKGKKASVDADRITRARAVPMTDLIEFNRQKYAPCIWHKDANPSMFYYEKMNKVHCFGCNANGDTIDVVRQQKQCGVGEAIEHLIGKSQ